MNWKNILTKGLPVVGILLAVTIGFAVASRPKAVPKVSNPNEVVVDFHNLKIKKTELYELMKTNYALNLILQDVDSKVLAEYYDKVDEDELTKEINKLKGIEEKDKDTDEENAKQLQKFYDDLVFQGIVKGATETEEQFEARIRDYYKYQLNLVQKVAAKDVAKAEIIKESDDAKASDKTDIVKEEMDKYTKNRDICVVSLAYDLVSDKDATLAVLKDLSGNALKVKFEELWNEQHKDDKEDEEKTEVKDDFFKDKLVCSNEHGNERVIYDNVTNSTYRDFIFGINVGTYEAKLISNKYYIVYKVAVAKNPNTDYTEQEKVEFRNIMIDRLVDKRTTSTYIKDTVAKLRTKHGFKLFDYTLAEQYTQNDSKFEVSKTKNKQAVYELNSTVVTTNELYDRLKVSGALSLSMDKIHFQALSQIKELQLTKEELKQLDEQIAVMKAQFYTQNYGMKWKDFIKLYGANSEKDLMNLLALDKLTSRYILGYKVDDVVKYAGVYPVNQEEINTKYNEWFEITASHILFKTNDDKDDANYEADNELAKLKAKQVIKGYDSLTDVEKARFENKDFIRYDYNNDGKLGLSEEEITKTLDDLNLTGAEREAKRVELEEYFKGLEKTKASDYSKVFAALAKEYSDDTGSGANGGSLGAFGPGKMVKEFELATKNIAKTRTDFPFSRYTATYTEGDTLALSDFGYHVIYVTGETTKTPIPTGYADKTIDEIRKALATETNTELKNYFDFIVKFETQLEEEHMSNANILKYMSELLENQNFEFKDPVMNNYYKQIHAIQLKGEVK